METYSNTNTFNGDATVKLPPGLYYIGNVSHYIYDNPFYQSLFHNTQSMSAHYYRGLEHVFVAYIKNKSSEYEGTDDNIYSINHGTIGICSAILANKHAPNTGKIQEFTQPFTAKFDGCTVEFEMGHTLYIVLKPLSDILYSDTSSDET